MPQTESRGEIDDAPRLYDLHAVFDLQFHLAGSCGAPFLVGRRINFNACSGRTRTDSLAGEVVRLLRRVVLQTTRKLTHGARCFARDKASLTVKTAPAAWSAFTGRYHHDSPWFGTVYIFVRKGQLWAASGTGYEFPLEQVDERTFKFVDTPASEADWVRFGDVCNGRAAWLSMSGEPFNRQADV